MALISHDRFPAEVFYYDFQARMHGSKVFRVVRPGIHWNDREWSHVLVTATQFARNPGVFLGVENFIGDARVAVANIAVREGEVHIRIDVDWTTDLDINVRMHVITMKLQQERLTPPEKSKETPFEIEAYNPHPEKRSTSASPSKRRTKR